MRGVGHQRTDRQSRQAGASGVFEECRDGTLSEDCLRMEVIDVQAQRAQPSLLHQHQGRLLRAEVAAAVAHFDG